MSISEELEAKSSTWANFQGKRAVSQRIKDLSVIHFKKCGNVADIKL